LKKKSILFCTRQTQTGLGAFVAGTLTLKHNAPEVPESIKQKIKNFLGRGTTPSLTWDWNTPFVVIPLAPMTPQALHQHAPSN